MTTDSTMSQVRTLITAHDAAAALGCGWDDLEVAIPAFLTITIMPFTYSITNGIGAGFVAYTFIKLARGKAQEVKPMMWAASGAFVIYFGIFYVREWLT